MTRESYEDEEESDAHTAIRFESESSDMGDGSAQESGQQSQGEDSGQEGEGED